MTDEMIDKLAGIFEHIPELQGPALHGDRANLANDIVKLLADNGLVVVPREPTDAMVCASGCECGLSSASGAMDNETYIRNDYTAMINASQEGEGHDTQT